MDPGGDSSDLGGSGLMSILIQPHQTMGPSPGDPCDWTRLFDGQLKFASTIEGPEEEDL